MSEKNNKEQIKPIPNFPGYFVSQDGKIFSLRKKKSQPIITNPELWQLREMKPYLTNNGYKCVKLAKAGKRYPVRINRIVLLTFVGCPSSPDMCAHHINHDRKDNRLCNLIWRNKAENSREGGQKAKRKVKGGRAGPKLSEWDIKMIRWRYVFRADSVKNIAKIYGITDNYTRKIIRRECWKHISNSLFG
ncbi:MAG: HNH endonuclease [Candidatus Aminicenantes bacterium]|nr:HNH endonuclease [Candidatus Aminicenantes bacterium]